MVLANRNLSVYPSPNHNPPTPMLSTAAPILLMAISYLLSSLIYLLSIMLKLVMSLPNLPKLPRSLLTASHSPRMVEHLPLLRNIFSHP